MVSRCGLLWVAGLVCGLVVCGCAEPRVSRIDFVVFEPDGREHRHYADFQEASYRMAPGGLLELALRTERPSSADPTQSITQILYLKSFWKPVPGRTFVESSQINARVVYAVLTPPTGVRYDGGAFVSYKLDKKTGALTASIESGSLVPRYRMGDAIEPFGASRFTGTIRATEKPRDVVTTLQMLESRFSQPIDTLSAP